MQGLTEGRGLRNKPQRKSLFSVQEKMKSGVSTMGASFLVIDNLLPSGQLRRTKLHEGGIESGVGDGVDDIADSGGSDTESDDRA